MLGNDSAPAPSYSAERIPGSDVSLVVFGTASHPLVRALPDAPVRRMDVSPYPLYLSDAAGDFHVLVRRYFESGAFPLPRLESAGSVEAVKRGVLAHASALGILPRYALLEEIRDGRAVVLPLQPPPPDMRIEAILGSRQSHHPAVLELLELIRTRFKP
jgi:DNA-binding transcriptional LysR family regulator